MLFLRTVCVARQRAAPAVLRTGACAAARSRPAAASCGGARWFSSREQIAQIEQMQGEIEQYSMRKQTSVSLETLLDTGSGKLLHASRFSHAKAERQKLTKHERTVMQVASFLRHELPVRLAHRAHELRDLPHGLSDMPSIRLVQKWYEDSFMDIASCPEIENLGAADELARKLQGVYSRHAETLVTVAQGLIEFRKQRLSTGSASQQQRRELLHEYDQLHHFLDNFFLHRIGVRMLIGQYLEIREPPRADHVGLVCTTTSPYQAIKEASDHARFMCERQFGDAPYVDIKGRTDLTFSYVPSHLYYMLFEVLKNSMRASVEHHTTKDDPFPELPDVRVIISDGEDNEDVVIKVSDEGGGFPRSHMKRIFSYLYTTAKGGAMTNSAELKDFGVEGPLAGLGYGLPISRAYARYFGGDLSLVPMEGWGTDAFLHLSRLKNHKEPLP
jgi:pyruvate dehydrogenase kinase 2/3/4